MIRLFSLLGIDRKLRQVRIAAGEGALAAEDRAQLLRLAWEEERERLRQILVLVVAVMGLTTVAVALLSVAVVVHFWDTPSRITAAWSVAGVWTVIWLVTCVSLMSALKRATVGIDAARREFSRDWHWVQAQIGVRPRDPALREPRPATRDELLARIDRQRERIAHLQDPLPGTGAAAEAQEEPLSATALRIAKEHPIATAAVAAGVVAAVGPRRIVRLAAWIAPVLWKMR
ncbi:phage holin family protein [Variovorax sp. J22R133]|uniref:phage holin family protein n=1 Tax=Variovorax brevis TaxID=3053503 RepID=UPI002578EFB3|nr:phage holin family protein [Variovorax sp. J22R133]MDM0112140.1 phage holin family protein [Variovorax sp. J22R133]